MEKCPNHGVIDQHNVTAERAAKRLSRQSYGGVRNVLIQREIINQAKQGIEDNPCELCGGMTADLHDGKLYCGREVPLEVVKSNEQILRG